MASIVPRSSPFQSLASVMIQRERESLALLAERHYTVTECSAALRIHTATFRTWLKNGLVKCSRTGKLGRIRVPESELLRLQKGGS